MVKEFIEIGVLRENAYFYIDDKTDSNFLIDPSLTKFPEVTDKIGKISDRKGIKTTRRYSFLFRSLNNDKYGSRKTLVFRQLAIYRRRCLDLTIGKFDCSQNHFL